MGSDLRKRKQELLLRVGEFDKKAKQVGLNQMKWEERYSVENELIDIYEQGKSCGREGVGRIGC